DVRIGARPFGPEVLAVTAPFNLFGTSSGDSALNNTTSFSLGGQVNDLYTIYLQEAGHVFGIGNSPDVNSVMYEFYQGPRTAPTADDLAALIALYGARSPDVFEGPHGNDTHSNATDYDGPLEADITTNDDVDYYHFNSGTFGTGATIQLSA